ncbi:hypothetical protein BD408DRAFT_279535 [Parasitella parasitica]|nr:hypothetical protein BD408DRAFT_279535 [Parasitella parasitica]
MKNISLLLAFEEPWHLKLPNVFLVHLSLVCFIFFSLSIYLFFLMGDSFRFEPQGKSWADIVEEDEELDIVDSQDERFVEETKEEAARESIPTDTTNHPESSTPDAENFIEQTSDQPENKQVESIHQPQEEEVAHQESPKVKEKPVLAGSLASKWASAPSESSTRQKGYSFTTTASISTEPSLKSGSSASKYSSAPSESSTRQKEYSFTTTAFTSTEPSLKSGSGASKWATSPDTTNRSRGDTSSRYNKNGRHGNGNYYGSNDRSSEGYDDNNNFRRSNTTWQEDSKTSNGRLNRSAFEGNKFDDARNGGFGNKANFSREKRYQEYYELTQKEADETPETKQPIESWNAYKPPVQENAEKTVEEDTQVVAETADHRVKEAMKATVEAASSSTSLLPVTSSISWADDNPDDDLNDDTILEDWIKPKTAVLQETSASTNHVVNEIKELTIDDMPPVKVDEKVADAARNSSPCESTSEPNVPWNGESAATTITAEASITSAKTMSPPKEKAPVYTWGPLNDSKNPEAIIPKSQGIPKIGKEEEEAAIASWQAAKLIEEPVKEAVAGGGLSTRNDSVADKQPSWNQSAAEQFPSKSSWNESTEPSSNQCPESSWSQPAVNRQPSPSTHASEPKPIYKWGPLNDFIEPKLNAKPKSDTIHLSKNDEAKAITQRQEPVNDSLAWNTATQKKEPIQAEVPWDTVAQAPEPVQTGSSWNNEQQKVATWDTFQQPTWSANDSSTGQQPQDWSSTGFKDSASTGSNKSSVKGSRKNKMSANVQGNTAGWKSFAETSAAVLVNNHSPRNYPRLFLVLANSTNAQLQKQPLRFL